MTCRDLIALKSTIREALRKPASQPCSCFGAGKLPRGCNGVCEDAVDRVASALAVAERDQTCATCRWWDMHAQRYCGYCVQQEALAGMYDAEREGGKLTRHDFGCRFHQPREGS